MILHPNSIVTYHMLFFMTVMPNVLPYPRSLGDWICAVGSVSLVLMAVVSGAAGWFLCRK
jgi:hypothetical protein